MLLSSLNFLDGKYQGNDLDFGVPLENQKFNLVQDICQISYEGKNIVIDIGWHPIDFEINANSHFKIYVVRDYDWSAPYKVYKVFQLEQLRSKLKEIVSELNQPDCT